MSFAALHKRVTFAYASLGFLVLGRGSELGVVPMVLFGLGVVASWFAEAPRIDAPSYTRNLTIATFVGFFVQLVRGVAGGDVVGLALEFIGALQLTRLAARRTSTEHLHIVGLGLLHLLAGTLLTTGLDYAALFLAFLVVTPSMLALTHLRAELEREHATPEELAIGTPVRLARILASEGVIRRAFLVLSSALVVPLFAITAGFFVFFPRVGLGMFSFGLDESNTTAGFGDSVDLGRFGTIRDDPTVVIRIFDASPGAGRDRTFRLRGTSFDRFDGTRWSRSPATGVRREEAYGSLLLFGSHPLRGPSVELHLAVAPLDDGVIFLPEGTRALRVTPSIESGRTIPRALVERPGVDLRIAELDGMDLDYVAVIDAGASDVPEVVDEAMRESLLKVPEGHARLAGLARELALGTTDPADIARRIEAHLARSGRFTYSLTTEAPRRASPLEHFLFETRRGHCELYASAMAIMLRSQGIPARNVTGFLGGRWNAYGGYHAIAQGDAHSWVEAYIDGSFRRFDPTPAARETARPAPTTLDTARAFFDALRTRWARDVVGFDMRTQIAFFRSLRDAFRGDRRSEGRFVAIEGDPPASSARRSSRSSAGPILAVLVIGGAFAIALVLVRRRRASGAVDPIVRLYRDLDRALAAHGLPRPPTRTPLEHLAVVEASGFPESASVRTLTDAYVRARYLGSPIPAPLVRDLAVALARIRRAPR